MNEAKTRDRGPGWRAAATTAALLAASGILAACGAGSNTAATGAENGGGDAAGKRITYVAVQDPNYNAIGCGAKARAEKLGIEFDQQNARIFSASSQIPVFNAAVARRPDAILTSPADANALEAPIESASESIPVATVLNTLENPESVTSQIVFDNKANGRAAAEFLAERADGREVKVAAVSFTPGASIAADDEVRGFEEGIKEYPNIEYVGAEYVGAEDEAGEATAKTSALLSAHPDLFGVFNHAFTSATGSLAAKRQRDSDMLIVAGYSGTDGEIVDALESGEVAAIADFPVREAGATAVDQLAAKLAGEPVEKTVRMQPTIYTRDSFDDPELRENLGPPDC